MQGRGERPGAGAEFDDRLPRLQVEPCRHRRGQRRAAGRDRPDVARVAQKRAEKQGDLGDAHRRRSYPGVIFFTNRCP